MSCASGARVTPAGSSCSRTATVSHRVRAARRSGSADEATADRAPPARVPGSGGCRAVRRTAVPPRRRRRRMPAADRRARGARAVVRGRRRGARRAAERAGSGHARAARTPDRVPGRGVRRERCRDPGGFRSRASAGGAARAGRRVGPAVHARRARGRSGRRRDLGPRRCRGGVGRRRRSAGERAAARGAAPGRWRVRSAGDTRPECLVVGVPEPRGGDRRARRGDRHVHGRGDARSRDGQRRDRSAPGRRSALRSGSAPARSTPRRWRSRPTDAHS